MALAEVGDGVVVQMLVGASYRNATSSRVARSMRPAAVEVD
jgi:hypothetical protein